MFHSILVPLDGSPFSEPALAYALELARRSGGRLSLVHVVQATDTDRAADHPAPDVAMAERLRSERRRYLEGWAERLAREGVAVEARLRTGTVAEEIGAAARELSADLVVMTTHGRGGLSRAWLGSVADRFLRTAEQPVLLIRPAEDGPAADPSRAPELNDLLIPLDGSTLAESVLGVARRLVEGTDGRITLLRAVEGPGIAPGKRAPLRAESLREEAERLLREEEEAAERYLEEVAGRLREVVPEVTIRVVEEEPARAILLSAEEAGSHVIALATHGHGAVSRALLGSVADKVIRGGTRPVLVHRPPAAQQALRERRTAAAPA